jgi:uncharacterized ferritin-like protein (DUF455 family)
MKLATIQTPQGNRAVLFHDGAHIDINATDSTLPVSYTHLTLPTSP